jgi:MFS transporter, DHA1 family, multidrug resistance protein
VTRTAEVEGASLPRPEMLLIGGVVLAISVGAFFRVPLLPAIGADLSMSASQLGLITTVFAVGRLCTDIPAGRLADRTPPLRSLAIAGAVLGLGSLVLATAQLSLWALVAAFLLGIASAISNTTGMTYFSTAAPTHQRGASMAAFSAALLGGQALGPMIGGVLADLTDWRIAIGGAAVVGFGVGIFGMLAQRARRRSDAASSAATDRESTQDHAEAAANSAGRDAPTGNRPGVPRSQRAVLYGVAFSSFFMLGAMPQTLVPIIGDERYGLSAAALGVALGLGGGCRFIGALVGGRLADRVSRKASLVPGMAFGAAGVGAFALDLGVGGWVMGIVLLSLGSYGISVAATMLADHAGGQGVGRRLGTYRFVGDIGLIAGPTVSAVLYERVGDDIAVLAVAGLLAVVALLCAFVLKETRWLDEPAR